MGCEKQDEAASQCAWRNDRRPNRQEQAFFFYNYDITIQNLENLRVRSVGLPAWKTGDLSTMLQSNGVLRRVYDPLTSIGRGGETQFANNVIPSSRLDPVAQSALSFVPSANRTEVDVSNEGTGSATCRASSAAPATPCG